MLKQHTSRGTAIVLASAALLSLAAVAWTHTHGYTLYYGDAEAHLNIARRILDNREPAYRELGTVWLPLPHVLMLPFVVHDGLWRSGLAGSIPSALCFVTACGFFFLSLRKSLDSTVAAAAGVAVLASNPNLLYLQSAPMTEALFMACLSGLLYFTLQDPVKDRPVAAGLCTLAAALTRYEGWFLIPAVFGLFLYRKRFRGALVYGAISSMGPVWCLLHNWWLFGNALYFYDGPWSPKAIYQRQLDAGMSRYPADGNWAESLHYYSSAARLTVGETVLLLGITGVAFALWKYRSWPVLLLSLPPAFYVWSLHNSGTPIFIPALWPFSYYNSRYALAALPLLAFGVAALVRWKPRAAIAVVALCLLPWVSWRGGQEHWLCWKESQVNSVDRRAYTAAAAAFLAAQYRPRDGIWYDFGDLTGILRQAGIPLRDTLHDGNELNWLRTVARPDLFLKEKWIVTFADSPLSKAAARLPFERVATFANGSAGKPVEIYRIQLALKLISLK